MSAHVLLLDLGAAFPGISRRKVHSLGPSVGLESEEGTRKGFERAFLLPLGRSKEHENVLSATSSDPKVTAGDKKGRKRPLVRPQGQGKLLKKVLSATLSDLSHANGKISDHSGEFSGISPLTWQNFRPGRGVLRCFPAHLAGFLTT